MGSVKNLRATGSLLPPSMAGTQPGTPVEWRPGDGCRTNLVGLVREDKLLFILGS